MENHAEEDLKLKLLTALRDLNSVGALINDLRDLTTPTHPIKDV